MYFIDSTIRPSIYDKDGEKIAENKYVYLIGDKEYYIGIKEAIRLRQLPIIYLLFYLF